MTRFPLFSCVYSNFGSCNVLLHIQLQIQIQHTPHIISKGLTKQFCKLYKVTMCMYVLQGYSVGDDYAWHTALQTILHEIVVHYFIRKQYNFGNCLYINNFQSCIVYVCVYMYESTKITEVNVSGFVYRLSHEEFSSLNGSMISS